ncbi:MAG: TetR family transcriptional regulator, partial [Thermodesulfobacteriota bacterium]
MTNKNSYFKYLLEIIPLFCEAGNEGSEKRCRQDPKGLLAVASEAFAEKGYCEATVSEICERTKSNVAAVNYHFGDKETLYVKAWRHAFY